jgi:hypothetical protein
MIDVYATAATFSDPRKLAQALASALMSIERVPRHPAQGRSLGAWI